MANKYEIDEQSDLADLAKQMEAVAARQDQPNTAREAAPVHEIATEAPPTARAPVHAPVSRRTLLFAALGALFLIIAVSAVFGVKLRKGSGKRAIPDIVGQTADDGTTTLEKRGFTVQVEYDHSSEQAAGTVIALVPAANTKVRPGSEILMRVAGKAPTQRPVTSTEKPGPEKPQPTASTDPIKTPAETKVEPHTVKVEVGHHEGEAPNVDPKSDTEVSVGEHPTLEEHHHLPATETVEESDIIMPDYVGRMGPDAARELFNQGLTYEFQHSLNTNLRVNTVIATDPPAGSRLQAGSKVILILAK